MQKRLTVGCRARIKPSSSWKDHGCAKREVLLTERSGRKFAAMVLPEGKEVQLIKPKVGEESFVQNQIAWVAEEDLELVYREFDTNLELIDWAQENDENFCPDCSVFLGEDPAPNWEGDYICPKCGCEWG